MDCCGDGYGLTDGYILTGFGDPTTIRFYNYTAQFCNYPIYLTSGFGITFFGGLVQSNVNGCYHNNLVRDITYDSIHFEGQGYPSNTFNVPDLIFDSTTAAVAGITLRSCRLAADFPPFSIWWTWSPRYFLL